MVIVGEAEVMAPTEKLRIHRTDLPEPLLADKNLRYDQLLAAAKGCPRIRMAVVHPCSREALEGALDAAPPRLIEAVLVGPEARSARLADTARLRPERRRRSSMCRTAMRRRPGRCRWRTPARCRP